MEKGKRMGGAQQHQRLVASLNKHLQQTTEKLNGVTFSVSVLQHNLSASVFRLDHRTGGVICRVPCRCKRNMTNCMLLTQKLRNSYKKCRSTAKNWARKWRNWKQWKQKKTKGILSNLLLQAVRRGTTLCTKYNTASPERKPLQWNSIFRVLQTLRHLVAMNENLKRQEAEFRAHCKEEMNRLQDSINKLKTLGGDDTSSAEEQVGSSGIF